MGCENSTNAVTTVDRTGDDLSWSTCNLTESTSSNSHPTLLDCQDELTFSQIYTGPDTPNSPVEVAPSRKRKAAASGLRILNVDALASATEEVRRKSMLADDLAFSAMVVHSVNEERRRSTVVEPLTPAQQTDVTMSLMSLGRATSFQEFCSEEVSSNPFSPMLKSTKSTKSGSNNKRRFSQASQSLPIPVNPLLQSLDLVSVDDTDCCPAPAPLDGDYKFPTSPMRSLRMTSASELMCDTECESEDDENDCNEEDDDDTTAAKAALARLGQLDEALKSYDSTLRRQSAMHDPNNKLLQLKVSSLRLKISKITSFVGVCPDCAPTSPTLAASTAANFSICAICKKKVKAPTPKEVSEEQKRARMQKMKSGW